MPNRLGTNVGLTGIPSLLISNLASIKDPEMQKALYQIQNWANSFLPVIPQTRLYNGTLTTSSGSFVNLTSQPSITLMTGRTVLVVMTAQLGITSASGGAQMAIAVSGATTVAAPAGSNILTFVGTFTNDNGEYSCACWLTPLNAGINTFTAEFRATGGGTATFTDPMLNLFPTASPL